MKILSITSFLVLSSHILALSHQDDVHRTEIEETTNGNQKMSLSDNSDTKQLSRNTQEGGPCGLIIELEPYNNQVTEKESTSFFGSPSSREVNGPIGGLFCKSGNNCPKLKLQSYAPALPWVVEDQTVARSGNGRWKNALSFGKMLCNANEIATGVKCKGPNCSSVQIKCSPLNSKLYTMEFSSRPAKRWTSKNNRKTQCGKSSYMVGVECGGNGCSKIRIHCSRIEYKNKKEPEPGCGTTDDEPPVTCSDRTLSNGLPWSDKDGRRCYEYSLWNWCSTYGDNYRNIYTPNEACCVCGGGNKA